MNIGDHLVTPRTGYTHHGLYIGNGEVIHYSGFANGYSSGEIAIASLEEFANGRGISIKNHPLRIHDAAKSVKRAYSRLGEDWYNVLLNNCEHFVTWCIQGFHSSSQVNQMITAVATAYSVLKQKETLRTVTTAAAHHVIQKEAERQVTHAVTSSLAKSVANRSLEAATAGAAAYSASTAGTALVSTFVGVSTAPVLVPVLTTVFVLTAVGAIFNWFD
ncbi:MAG: lecithin retinol acyltransferase family protein [Methylovulum sp.]|uniref:lecithin retinol acyltransferase family protein n=1 Tax=Methylovulum sp. TaxID=1916980 RepID=UPI00262294DF|nr:lecithin retinol acyltransferase family protein [Methylovulum sp.]MDD2724980.1 lecithin retinol acyltransferase family protein [Methylovulum sp.]